MTRYISTEIKDPIQSTLRVFKDAVIPPISFVGELEIGTSPGWFPTHRMYITAASIVSNGDGVNTANVMVLKEEPMNPRPLILFDFSLGAATRKMLSESNGILVTPYDKIYLVSWVDSYHTGVAVQMVGFISP